MKNIVIIVVCLATMCAVFGTTLSFDRIKQSIESTEDIREDMVLEMNMFTFVTDCVKKYDPWREQKIDLWYDGTADNKKHMQYKTPFSNSDIYLDDGFITVSDIEVPSNFEIPWYIEVLNHDPYSYVESDNVIIQYFERMFSKFARNSHSIIVYVITVPCLTIEYTLDTIKNSYNTVKQIFDIVM